MSEPDNTTENQASPADRIKKYQWPKGVSGNPAGRPKGSISPRDRIRQMFEANPQDFDEFLENYLNDKMNYKHVVELLDGKPHQSVDHTTLGKELPTPIINVLGNNSNTESNSTEEED